MGTSTDRHSRCPSPEVTEEHLSRLVTENVREDADLDFKLKRYGKDDKQELAADIAAMANARGGLIIIGIRENDDGVALDTEPVELTDEEEARIRLIAASNIAPHVDFDIRVVARDKHRPAATTW